MPDASALERLVRRDRAVAAVALVLLAALAWLALPRLPMPMASMPSMPMAADLLLLFAMWSVMMVAMMLPSVAPMILLVAGVARRRGPAGPAVATGLFAAGYLLAWVGFSAVAATAQWGLHRAALLTPAMASASPVFSGLVLVAAGLYQWLPLKSACLGRCRSPFTFLGAEWREGRTGALVMGARHGLFCLGCCWAWMALLFVGGVMRLPWIAALAALVLVEKLGPGGAAVGRAAGTLAGLWGVYLLLGPIIA